MPLTLDQMRRAISASELPADVAAQILLDFTSYLRLEGRITLDQAFGLTTASGCDPWYARLAREVRDQAICAVGEGVIPIGSISERADAVRANILRYRSTWQRRDQYRTADVGLAEHRATLASLVGRPSTRAEIDRLLFVAFSAADGAIPDSFDHLRKVLATTSY